MNIVRGYVHYLGVEGGRPVIACGNCDEEGCRVAMWGNELSINCQECDLTWLLDVRTLSWKELKAEGDITYATGGAIGHPNDRW